MRQPCGDVVDVPGPVRFAGLDLVPAPELGNPTTLKCTYPTGDGQFSIAKYATSAEMFAGANRSNLPSAGCAIRSPTPGVARFNLTAALGRSPAFVRAFQYSAACRRVAKCPLR